MSRKWIFFEIMLLSSRLLLGQRMKRRMHGISLAENIGSPAGSRRDKRARALRAVLDKQRE
jgi:hypothetical protein